MNRLAASVVVPLLFLSGHLSAYDFAPEPGLAVTRVAFGSCNSPLESGPVWDSVLSLSPNVWIWLGDTVYADDPRPSGTPDEVVRSVLDRLPSLYERQNAIPSYALLRSKARVIGTWDDHDYGLNDAGAEFAGKVQAQQCFMDFYGEAPDSPRRARPGVYSSYRYGPPGKTLQVIILDTRYFRSSLKSATQARSEWVEGRPGNYVPTSAPDSTMLGESQWKWLESVLRQPADVRLVVSSIQVLPDDHRFEKWGNLPEERRRLLKLIRDTKASRVVLLSGDRHTGELSCFDPLREPNGTDLDPGYPLYELTSSAINRSAPTSISRVLENPQPRAVVYTNEINRFRVGTPLVYDHFGLISIDWEAADGPLVTLALHLDTGAEVLRQKIQFK